MPRCRSLFVVRAAIPGSERLPGGHGANALSGKRRNRTHKKSPTGGPLPRPCRRNTRRNAARPRQAPPAIEDESPTSMIVEMASDARRLIYEQVTLWTAEPRRLVIKELNLEVPEGEPLALDGSWRSRRGAPLGDGGGLGRGPGADPPAGSGRHHVRLPSADETPGGAVGVCFSIALAGKRPTIRCRQCWPMSAWPTLSRGTADWMPSAIGRPISRAMNSYRSSSPACCSPHRFAFLDCLAGASDKLFHDRLYPARSQPDHLCDRRLPARAARLPPQPARLARRRRLER